MTGKEYEEMVGAVSAAGVALVLYNRGNLFKNNTVRLTIKMQHT